MREDIKIIKVGLTIPKETIDYKEFVEKMKISEQKFLENKVYIKSELL